MKPITVLKSKLGKGTKLQAYYYIGKFRGETHERIVECITKENKLNYVWVSGHPDGGHSFFILQNITIIDNNTFTLLNDAGETLIKYTIHE